MRYSTILVVWGAVCAANDVIQAPLSIRIQNGGIPKKLANSLVEGSHTSLLALDPDSRYERLFLGLKNDSAEYICSMPRQKLTFQQLDQPEVPEEDESAILKTAVEIIHGSFTRNKCAWSYDLRGFYWTYGYCHGDKIIQYHETAPLQDRPQKHVPGAPNMVYVLGRFSKASINELEFQNQASPQQYMDYIRSSERTFQLLDEKLLPFSHHSPQKVVMQLVTDGSICDMTFQPRSAEVVYKCDASGGGTVRILDVTEIRTCHYKMFIHVPDLCKYEPFMPNKNLQDSLVPVTCESVSDSVDGEGQFEDYAKEVLRKDSSFPVPANNRISIAEHDMIALSRGFYLAQRKTKYNTRNEYYNSRNVILFNGFHDSLQDLSLQFGRVIFNGIGKSILAPSFEKGEQIVLAWLHLFIMWFEIYNFKGEFLGLSRLLNDGSSKKRRISAQIFDPVTLRDVDGDSVLPDFSRPEFEAPYGMWNFEMFSARGSGALKKRLSNPFVRKVQSVVLHNDGGLKGELPNVQAFDGRGNRMKGQFNDDGKYVFELVPNEGRTETFTVSVDTDSEYVEIPVTYYDMRAPAPKETTGATVTVTQTVKANGESEDKKNGDDTGLGVDEAKAGAAHDEL